jgi:hypothetical protein
MMAYENDLGNYRKEIRYRNDASRGIIRLIKGGSVRSRSSPLQDFDDARHWASSFRS